MTLDFAERVGQVQHQARERISAAATADELEAVRVDVLGRKGSLTQFGKELGKLSPQEKAAAGKALNAAKNELEAAMETRQQAFAQQALNQRLAIEWIDLTLPAPGPRRGSLHPVTQIRTEIEDLFTSMGFAVLAGPEVETEYYNFDALNIPPTHPARDMQDTFYIESPVLLRTHTSPMQIRAMKAKAPVQVLPQYEEELAKDVKLPTVSSRPVSSVVQTISE